MQSPAPCWPFPRDLRPFYAVEVELYPRTRSRRNTGVCGGFGVFPCISVFPNLWRPPECSNRGGRRARPPYDEKEKAGTLRAYHRPGDLSEIPIIPTP